MVFNCRVHFVELGWILAGKATERGESVDDGSSSNCRERASAVAEEGNMSISMC